MNVDRLAKFAKEKNIDLSEKQLNMFSDLGDLLAEKNKVMNLTAIKNPKEVEVKHFIDSLTAVPVIKALCHGSFSYIDVGCGAGIPGIPLKIAMPESRAVLLDSLNKKISFVNEACGCLGLENIQGVAARAEDFAGTKARERFDICVSRAVARMAVLLEYCLPFVKLGGHAVLYKSGDVDAELREALPAMEILGGDLKEIKKLSLPCDGGKRSLVIIEKTSPTPEKYPRRAGKPAKSPLK